MSKSFRIVLGLAISAVCLWFVFRKFDFNVLRQTLAEASYGWFFPATFMFGSNMIFRSFRWRVLLSPIKQLSVMDVMPKLLIGFFMNNTLPARGGEIVRAVALSKATGIPTSSILGSIVAERFSDMLGLSMVLLLASKLLPWDKLPVLPIFGVIIIGGIAVALFIHFGRKSSIEGIFYRITSGFHALRSPIKLAQVIIFSLAIWLGEMLIALFVSRALHLNLNLFESAGLLTGLSVGVMIPAGPGYVGTYEFFGKSVLALLGKSEGLALGFVLVLHFFQLILVALAALPPLILPKPINNESR